MFLNNPEQVRAFFEQSTALKGGLNIRLTQQEDHLQLYLGLSIGGSDSCLHINVSIGTHIQLY